MFNLPPPPPKKRGERRNPKYLPPPPPKYPKRNQLENLHTWEKSYCTLYNIKNVKICMYE